MWKWWGLADAIICFVDCFFFSPFTSPTRCALGSVYFGFCLLKIAKRDLLCSMQTVVVKCGPRRFCVLRRGRDGLSASTASFPHPGMLIRLKSL